MTIYKGTTPIAGLAHNTIVNGFHLFDFKWSDKLLNDISWINSSTFSWQSGNVYTSAYNKLVTEYATGTTETVGGITYKRTTNGFKIADATQEQAILDKYNSDGIAWFYILDTTNTRFKLPRTKFGFEGLRTNAGDDIAESLPNITGSAGVVTYTNKSSSGALTGTYTDIPVLQSGGGLSNGIITLNASNSSSTYQDNAPVQERAIQMYLYFYVGEFSQTAIEQTAGITSEQLNAKVDLNASNFNSTGKSTLSGYSMPSSRYINLTLGASGTTYTAPANGWFLLCKRAGTTNPTYVGTYEDAIFNKYESWSNGEAAWQHSLLMPVKRGQNLLISYVATGNTETFRFIYAEGD